MNIEPILDETSLIPASLEPGARIKKLADVVKALDTLGLPRVLRSVHGFADREICDGKGLRHWCFASTSAKDAGRLIALRLDKPPYINGPGGLLAKHEQERAIEARAEGQEAFGLGYAALIDFAAVALERDGERRQPRVEVGLSYLDPDRLWSTLVQIPVWIEQDHVEADREFIKERQLRAVTSGQRLLDHAPQVFPSLVFGPDAGAQIAKLAGADPLFPSLIRHLRALDEGARQWASGAYVPKGTSIDWSQESGETLRHPKYGPLRDFRMPEDEPVERFSYHTKFPAGFRMYFIARKGHGAANRVVIGYFGKHLSTVSEP